MAVYGKGLFGGDRYGGGSGTGVITADIYSGPIAMTGTALVQAGGSRAVRLGVTPMVGRAFVTANLVVTLPFSGNVSIKLSPAAYFRADVPPVSPASLGLTNVYIERVSPIMPNPTLQDGRPV